MIELREVTQGFLKSIEDDAYERQTPAAIVDFGLDSELHLDCLVYGVTTKQITPQQLDAALGNGPMLSAIADRLVDDRDHSIHPYQGLRFQTSWDVICGRDGGPGEPIEQRRQERSKEHK